MTAVGQEIELAKHSNKRVRVASCTIFAKMHALSLQTSASGHVQAGSRTNIRLSSVLDYELLNCME